MNAQDHTFDEIKIGDTATFDHTFTEEDVLAFANLSGDINPLHVDAEYAKTTKFKKPIVHGMLLGSLCSRLVGMYIPGKHCLYLKQNLSFKMPVFIDDMVTVVGTVVAKSPVTKIITLSVKMSDSTSGIIVVEGEAHTQFI